MIVNIEQKQGKFIISYVKKDGLIGFMQLNIPSNHQYSYVYAQRNRGVPDLLSWDFKPVRKVPAQFLNRHRIQEFFMDAGEDLTLPLFEANMPVLSSLDIEVEVTDEGFAEPELANNRILSAAFSQYPDIVVFGSKPLLGEECKYIEDKINEHVKIFGKTYNFIYKYHENEADMIYDLLYNYVRKASLVTGWNFWGYDWRYITNRCRKLNMDISWIAPTGQWYDHKIKDRNRDILIKLPQHKLIVDYMTIYRKWDRTVEIKENDTLDFVTESALEIKKVKYPGTLQDLYNKEYIQFIFYNAIDAILVELLDIKLKTMRTFLGLANITKVEAMSAFSPIQMLESTLTRYAYKRKQVFPKREGTSERKSYEGAFVFEPTPNLYPNVASYDYSSLYPTIMRQFKISIENLLLKDKNHITKEKEIKTTSGAVFDSSYEPLLPEILTDYFKQRNDAKKISFLAEKEGNELERILKERQKTANSEIN